MIHNRFAKKYLRRVHSVLPGSARMTKQIMKKIRSEVSSYFEEYPQADANLNKISYQSLL